MNHNEHVIRLQGAAAGGPGVSGHVMRDLVEVLVTGTEQTLRYRIEGRSTAKGTVPKWLKVASDFTLVWEPGKQDGATFAVISRPLTESLPDRFTQLGLLEDFDPAKSPVELF